MHRGASRADAPSGACGNLVPLPSSARNRHHASWLAVAVCLVRVLPGAMPLLQIQFLSDCDHPNVVRYLGSFRLPDALWIVMEHCGGGSVGDLLQVTALPVSMRP